MLRIIGINVFISLRELITSILLDVFGGGLRLFAFWRVQPFASPSSQASGRGSANMPFLSLTDVPDRNQIINRQKIYTGAYCLSRRIGVNRRMAKDALAAAEAVSVSILVFCCCLVCVRLSLTT
jgi:hypothetical protein